MPAGFRPSHGWRVGNSAQNPTCNGRCRGEPFSLVPFCPKGIQSDLGSSKEMNSASAESFFTCSSQKHSRASGLRQAARTNLSRFRWYERAPWRRPHSGAPTVTDHVYKSLELTGSSRNSSDEAIRIAIERASKSIRDIRWFHVTEVRGHVVEGKVAHWQVTVKVGFTLQE